MPDPIVWESLPKSQSDPSTIVEEIGSQMAVHNADPEAHMQALASLDAHRTSEIMDHLADSVVNDKLYPTARAYVAIVDPSNPADFDNIPDAVEYAQSVGGGTVYLRRGVYNLDEDLRYLPTVSLQGDGIQDTIINSTDGGGHKLTFADIFWPPLSQIAHLTTEGASLVLDNPDGSDWSGSPVGGMFAYVYGDAITDLYTIMVDPGPGEIVLADEVDGEGTDLYVDAYQCITATEDSDLVTLGGFQSAAEYGLIPGMFIEGAFDDIAYYVVAIIDDQTIQLDRPFELSDGNYGVTIYYKGKHAPRINDITFQGGNYGWTIDWNEGVQQVVVERCEFLGYGFHIGFSPLLGDTSFPRGLVMSNCFIHCPGAAQSGPAINTRDSYIENCTFIATSNGAKACYPLGRTTITSCEFYASGYVDHAWLQGFLTSDTSGYRIENNYLEQMQYGGPDNPNDDDPKYAAFWSNNVFEFSSGRSWSIVNDFCQVMNCTFIFASGQGLTLASSMDHGVFVGNIIKGSFTDSTTTSAVGNNVDY